MRHRVRTFGKPAGTIPNPESTPDFLEVVEKFGQIGYWHINLHSEVVFFSSEVCRTHGMPPGYRPESLKECIEWYHPDDQEIVRQTVSSAATDGEPFSFEARLITVSKGVRWVSVNGEVRKDENGVPDAIIGTQSDISVAREMNSRLGEALREAKSANRLKDMFLANMSHELRTPLNAIIGFSQIITMMRHEGKVDETVGGYATDIESAGGHLLSIIEDIFSLAQMEADSDSVTLEAIDIGSVLDDVRSLTGAESRKSGHTILFEGNNLTSDRVIADRSKVTKILVYLLSNAMKLSPADAPIRVSVSTHDCGRIFFYVADNGPGIPADLQEVIFERFERMEPSEASVEGIGVGLAIARDIVSAMGGEIGVDSVEGEGSSFWMAFPLAEASSRAIAV